MTLRRLIEKGYVALGGYQASRKTWAITYLSKQLQEQVEGGVLIEQGFDEQRNVINVRYTDPRTRRIKTVWHRSSHDAGAYGTDLLKTFLGEKRFNYPKSLYAVRDTLAAVIGSNPDALVLDFFGGSATTLHATCLLNAQDDGRRRCIVVTNNEVDEKQADKLRKKGLLEGDPEFERHGIFEAVARPRVEAALTGKTAAGDPSRVCTSTVAHMPMASTTTASTSDSTTSTPTTSSSALCSRRCIRCWMKAGAKRKRARALCEVQALHCSEQANSH